MELPDNISGQITAKIMQEIIQSDSTLKLTDEQETRMTLAVYNQVSETGIDQRMRDDYDVIENYNRRIKERYPTAFEWFENQWPFGIGAKDAEGNYHGINVITKTFIRDMFNIYEIDSERFRFKPVEEGIPALDERRDDKDKPKQFLTINTMPDMPKLKLYNIDTIDAEGKWSSEDDGFIVTHWTYLVEIPK